jgi:hypothetical protein
MRADGAYVCREEPAGDRSLSRSHRRVIIRLLPTQFRGWCVHSYSNIAINVLRMRV